MNVKVDHDCSAIKSLPVHSTDVGSTIHFRCSYLQAKLASTVDYCPVQICQIDGHWSAASISCGGRDFGRILRRIESSGEVSTITRDFSNICKGFFQTHIFLSIFFWSGRGCCSGSAPNPPKPPGFATAGILTNGAFGACNDNWILLIHISQTILILFGAVVVKCSTGNFAYLKQPK